MRAFERALLRGLAEHGWDHVGVTPLQEWWAEQAWTIRSVRERRGYELTLTFLVDDATGRVRAIAAGRGVPRDRAQADAETRLLMSRGSFATLFPALLAELEALREGPFHRLRWYAATLQSVELCRERLPDHTELHHEWHAAWSQVARRDDVPVRVREAAARLSELIDALIVHSRSIEEIAVSSEWPLLRGAVEALIAAIDEHDTRTP
ncbi:MAG: hypothetical protein SangKO_029050 [Sandaracinaceae bacterium]